MGSLAVRLIKNSVVYPTIRVASHPGKLLMGVYDENCLLYTSPSPRDRS